jgi:hypothetical protein
MMMKGDFLIFVAVTSGVVLLVAALTTNVVKTAMSVIKGLVIKTIVAPGRAYWAARMDAFGDAAAFAAIGAIVLDALKLGENNIALAGLLFLGAVLIFLTSNWFKS